MLEIWRTHGAQDFLCTQYEGTIYESNSGNYPVTDTHPNCRCTRELFATSDDSGVAVPAPPDDPPPPVYYPGPPVRPPPSTPIGLKK